MSSLTTTPLRTAMKAVAVAVLTPTRQGRGISVLIVGPPGGGKTTCARDLFEAASAPHYTLAPSTKGAGGFGVVPVPVEAGGRTVLSFPALHRLVTLDEAAKQAGHGLLLLDEANSSSSGREVSAGLMAALLEKTVGDFTLSPEVAVVGTANPVSQGTECYEWSLALRNRVTFLVVEDELDAHTDYMASLLDDAGASPAEMPDLRALKAQIDARWRVEFAKAIAEETAFLRRNPSRLRVEPAPDDLDGPWASPRSWEAATRLRAACKAAGLHECIAPLLTGTLGTGVASEWMAFCHVGDLPDPVALLEGRETFTHDRARPDRTLLVATSVATVVRATLDPGTGLQARYAKAAWELFAALSTAGAAELVVAAQATLVAARLDREAVCRSAANAAFAAAAPVLLAG